jgi:CheY-like chemotaxis protein
VRPTPDTPQRVLILEDDPVQAQLLERILIGGNYDADSIGDPRALLCAMDAQPVPDLLLADILLPHVDGLTTCVRLAEDPRWCLLPTILMTSSSDPALLRAAERLPVPPEAVLTKPLDPMSLLRWVRRTLAADEPLLRLHFLQRRRLSLTLRLRQVNHPGRVDAIPAAPDLFSSPADDRGAVTARLRLSLRGVEDEINRIQGILRREEAPRA